MSFTAVTITATYKDATGAELTGTVAFELTGPMRDGTSGPIVPPTLISETLVSGSLPDDFTLYGNDDSTTQPQGVQYKVSESVGGFSRQYNITVPHGAGSIDLSALAP